jgi:c-di-GMP-binding flagellar brake protein YcgR
MNRKPRIIERRKFLRLPVEIKVKFKLLDTVIDTSGLTTAKAVNLSSGGILFQSNAKLSKDDTVQLKIDFTRGKSKYDLAAIGRVSRCTKMKNGHYTIGLQFLEIYQDDLYLLKGYIKKKTSSIK